MADELLTVTDVARLLRKPASWVYNNVTLLPVIRVGRSLRFRRGDMDAWLDGNRAR